MSIELVSPSNDVSLSSGNSINTTSQSNFLNLMGSDNSSLSISQASNTLSLSVSNNISLIQTSNTINITLNSVIQRINYVNSDEKLFLDGPDGDTYLIHNSTLDRIEIWKNDTIKAAW